MIVISNAGPLIHLAEIKMFGLLKELFEKVYILPSVYNEVVVVGSSKPGSKETREAESEWIRIKKT